MPVNSDWRSAGVAVGFNRINKTIYYGEFDGVGWEVR